MVPARTFGPTNMQTTTSVASAKVGTKPLNVAKTHRCRTLRPTNRQAEATALRALTSARYHDRIASNPMAKTRYRYNIMLRPEPEGGFTAMVPALPGCVTYGRTLEEAREMAKDAISGYIASLRKHNDAVPPTVTL